MTIRVDFDKYIFNLLLLPIHEDQWNRSRTSFVLPAKVEDLRVFRIIIIYLENEHINVRHLSSSEDHQADEYFKKCPKENFTCWSQSASLSYLHAEHENEKNQKTFSMFY